MPTKTTTKSAAARKPATARKTVKPATTAKPALEPGSKGAKGSKVESAANTGAAVSVASKTRADAESDLKEAEIAKTPKRVVETVSLIEEKQPRPKRTDADAAKRSVLPPISRLHSTAEAPPVSVAPPPVAPAAPPTPEVPPPETVTPPVEGEPEPQKVIHIKPPIVVKELAAQLGLKNFQLIKELMDDYNIFANPNKISYSKKPGVFNIYKRLYKNSFSNFGSENS